MKAKTMILTMMLLLTATLAVAGNASADHGYHECTEEDPCDNNSYYGGCEGDPTVAVDCEYDGHWNCYYGTNEDGENAKFCNHYERDCLVSLTLPGSDSWCHVHGSIPLGDMHSRFTGAVEAPVRVY